MEADVCLRFTGETCARYFTNGQRSTKGSALGDCGVDLLSRRASAVTGRAVELRNRWGCTSVHKEKLKVGRGDVCG